jgi:triacylglycerol lipase
MAVYRRISRLLRAGRDVRARRGAVSARRRKVRSAPRRSVAPGGLWPVLLVPGWSDTAASLEPLRRALCARGWPRRYVATLDFRDPYGTNREHAAEIAAAANALMRRTGRPRLDVVAHSMGGLAARLLVARPQVGGDGIRRIIALGTPHRGTWVAWLAWGEGGREMRPGSRLLAELEAAERAAAAVELCCVRARLDLRILPAASARLDGARDGGSVWCTHRGMLRSRAVAERVVAELWRR